MQDRIDHRPPPGSPEREAWMAQLAAEIMRCSDRMAVLARNAKAVGEDAIAERLIGLAEQVRRWRDG